MLLLPDDSRLEMLASATADVPVCWFAFCRQ